MKSNKTVLPANRMAPQNVIHGANLNLSSSRQAGTYASTKNYHLPLVSQFSPYGAEDGEKKR